MVVCKISLGVLKYLSSGLLIFMGLCTKIHQFIKNEARFERSMFDTVPALLARPQFY
jgi:hypothetical protein